MENVQTVSGKVVAAVLGVLVLLVASAIGAFYYWQQSNSGESQGITTDSTLTGSVVYRERVPLPAGSSLVVQLLDVTDSGAEPVLVAEQTIITRGENVPIAYAIPYNQSQIVPERLYALEASILGEGNLYFATPEITPVLTANNPTGNVDLLLTQNGVATVTNEDGSVGAPTLPGTMWNWIRTDNDPFASSTQMVAPAGNEYVLTFRQGGTFNSTTDCNRIAGSYALNGEVVSLGSVSMTEMACPDSLDTLYAAELGRVTSYVIDGDELRLILQQDSGVMIFERQADASPEEVPPAPIEGDEAVAPDEPVLNEDDAVMCTMDAMECPDGSFVGRVPPSCVFAACPGA